MKKTTVQAWQRQLLKRQKEVGALRDKIRDDLSEMEDLQDTCQTAYEDIQRAIDSLSELS
jgi:hypothetical protein